MINDADLVTRTLQGETRAFEAIVQKYKNSVYGTALSCLSDFDLAYDVSQEVFLRAFLKLNRLAEPSKLAAWLHRITVNTCRKWHKQQRDMLSIEHLDQEDMVPIGTAPPETPAEVLEGKERRKMTLKALSALSEKNRQALTLYYMEGLSIAEVASFLQVSQEVVRQRMYRARKALRQEVMNMIDETIKQETPNDRFREDMNRLLDHARTCFLKAEYQAAVSVLEQASDMAPDDTLVALLLADAYTWGKTAVEIAEDSQSYQKAKQVLTALMEREPENLLARIKLAELKSVMGSFDALLKEHETNLRLARGGPFEAWALLRLARLHAPRRRHEEALGYYRRVIDIEPGLAGVALFEMGVSCYLNGDLPEAVRQLEQAVSVLEDRSQETFGEYTQRLMGEAYWRFWNHQIDERLSMLCHIHTWLAGIYMKNGNTAHGRNHLQQAVAYLNREKQPAIHERLAEEMRHLIDTEFPELTDER